MTPHRWLEADPANGPDIFGLPLDAANALVHLVPVPFEATVSYRRGAAGGPAAILAASAQVDLLDPDFGRPYRAGIHLHGIPAEIVKLNKAAIRDATPIIERVGDLGGSKALLEKLERVNQAGAEVNRWVEGEVRSLLDAGRLVGVIGGDHSIPFGAIAAHAAQYPGMAVLHLDAHADLREAYEGFTWSHASIMHNVTARLPAVSRLVQIGVRDLSDEEMARIRTSRGRITTFLDHDLRDRKLSGEPFRAIAREVIGLLPEDVYVSWDIDGLDPSLCPNTGTPVPGGLSLQEAAFLLVELVRSGRRIVGFDLCEVAPDPKGSEWDANVGARVLYKLIGALVASRVVALSPA